MKSDDWNSSHLVNFAYRGDDHRSEWKQVQDDLMKLGFVSGKSGSKDFLVSKLGRQSYCWTHPFRGRMHVWESESRTWRAYAKNGYGISFEVREEMTESQALGAWNDFKKKIGLDEEVSPLDEHKKSVGK